MPERLFENVSPDFTFTDERGVICQLVREGYSQVNVVTTKKGSRRGGFHYHRLNEELFYIVSGEVEVEFRLDDRTEKSIFRAGDMFLIHKEVRHDFNYLEDTVLVGLYDAGVELPDGSKDIITD